jgi:multiple sugar transport system permease protein
VGASVTALADRMPRHRARAINLAFIAVAAAGAVGMMLPFMWMFAMSFRPPAEAYRMPPSFLPDRFDFQNYRAVFEASVPLLQMYWNSFKIAGLVTAGQLATCTAAAFAFARLRFPGRDALFSVMLLGLMVPMQALVIPSYLGMAQLGLIDSHWSLILLYLTSSFGVFLVRQFMLGQPRELEEAAKIDGAGYWTIFRHVSVPQLGPVLSALGIITFTQTWNMYFQPLIFLETWENMTLPIGLAYLRGFMGSGNLAVVMAAMSMVITPVLLVFLFAQRFIISGLTMSGIKG